MSFRHQVSKIKAMEYAGSELELFAHATNWKTYFKSQLIDHINGNVLEVGAGIGETTRGLFHDGVLSWTALEPDSAQVNKIINDPELGQISKLQTKVGTTIDLAGKTFDTILYIDVLEHIEKDQEEFDRACKLLAPGGKLIVLSPAHQYLFSPFDKSIGHFRRYDKKSIRNLHSEIVKLDALIYLDSLGWLLSCANKLILSQSMPTKKQILFWDRTIIPISKILDRIINFCFGKTIVGIWHRI